MTYFKGLKKIGVNTTVLATSVALVACGGGGGGYYGNTNSNTNTGNPSNPSTTKEVAGVSIQLSKGTLKVQGDELIVTAKALDKDSGGVAGAKINLNIKDGEKNGATSDASTKTTGNDGTVTFTVKLNGSNQNLTELLFTTTVVDTTIQNQAKAIVTGAGTVVQSQYELKFDNVTPLQVSGGETAVRIRAIDTNGGGVPNEKVTLKVKDFQLNGVMIKGSSSAVTNDEGYVTFTLQLPNGKEADRLALIASGVALEATLTEQSGAVKTQVSTAQVVSVKNIMSSLSLSTSSNNKVDAIGGTIEVEAIAKNPEGLAVANKEISLKLDDLSLDYGAKLINSTAKTDENGKAKFTIKTEANSLNPTGQLLVNNGIKVSATSTDGSVSTQTSTITVVSVATESVSYLTATSPDAIDVSGGQAKITITAKDAKGGAVANKQINLTIPNSQNNGLTILEGSKLNTDNNGQASFTVKFDKNTVSINEINNLLSNGVTVAASYTTINNNVLTQTTKINFTNKNATLEKDVQRLELTASKGVVSAKNDTVQIKVRAISADGNFVANKMVTLGLASTVTENGVTIGGDKAISQKTNDSGYAIFTLNVDAYNQQSIDNLVKSGITIAVGTTLADGSSVKQNMQIMVEAAPLQAVDVSYLSITPDSMINTNKGQTTVTVRAVDRNGGVLANQDITLNIDKAKEYGLTIITGSKAKTNAQGEATFVIQYDGRVTDATILTLLKTQGVLLTATYQPTTGAAITQTSYIRYYDQTSDVDVKQLAISLGKGVAIASNDSFDITVKAVDENGQPINGRKINLALSDIAKDNGVQIVTAPAKVTENGEAKFTVQLKAPNTDAVNALVAAGLLITATAQQNSGASISQTAKVMVAASAQGAVDVAYLAIDQLDAINVANNAERNVTVRAYNSSGMALANKDIELKFAQSYSGIRIKEGSVLTTNSAGEVKFTIVYDAVTTTVADKNKLLNEGLGLNASYGNIGQTIKLSYFEAAKNIQRMDLVVDEPALVLIPNNQNPPKVKATVILKDDAGQPIIGRQVILAINAEALQNGIRIEDETGGLVTVVTDEKGQSSINLIAQPKDKAAVDALVASGISLSATAAQGDGTGNVFQKTQITVSSAATLNEISYLTAENTQGALTTTGSSSTNIIVKAFNNKGKAIAGKLIKLALSNVPAGLTIKVTPSSQVTASDGSASFTISYTAPANLTAEQIKGLLAGIQATATYTSEAGTNITQSTVLQFVADDAEIAKDAQRIELLTSKGLVFADNDTFTFTTKVFDKDGNPLKDKLVGFGLNAAAVANGVTFVGAASKKTDANGEVTFTVNVKAANDQMIENLVANGITLAASVVQADGSKLSQTTQVMVKAPVAKDVVALTTTLSEPVISVLGGTSIVAVKAEDANGNPLVNKEINFGLAGGGSSRVKVDKTTATTNANGIAYFTVTVENGDSIDQLLVEKGITYAVSTKNVNSTTQPVVTQVGKVNISVPTEAINLTMDKTKADLLASGDTSEVFAKLIDNTATGIKSYPVTFTVIDSALNGVTINGQETAVITTDTSGNAKVSLKLTKVTGKQYTDLLANGVTVRASITLPNGVVRTQTVHFNVNEASSNYHLVFSSVSKSAMDVNGDRSIVTVTLLDRANQPVRNQEVILAANNAGGLTIGNSGSSGSVNTSGGPVTVKTDSNGNAFFSVAIDGATVDKQLLLASGIELTATNTDEIGGKATQIYRISTVDNSSTPTLQPARYSLRLASSKPTMNVRDDTADVTITLVDANGGGVAGQYVTLSIDNLARNGAIIVGPSGLTTDMNGQAILKIKIDETTRRNYTAADFINDDLHLTAHFNETGRIEATQIFAIDIVPAVVQTPRASIVIGVNPTEVASSSDGVYYTKNLSVSVVDFDGKPLANQTVTLDVTPLTYIKGRNLWALAPKAGSDPAEKWVFANQPYFDLSSPNIYLDSNGKPMNNMGTPTDFTDDVAASTTLNNVHACVADSNGAAVGVNNTPVKVVTFVSQSGNTQNTFTTDANGKFDFAMRYPKIYAQWLNVQIGASSTVASLPNRTTYNLGLASLSSDYSTDGTYSPNQVSPYGTSFTCP
ncbi:hypothetical protein [Acinetobacter modestus]|uniref:beta strand repeat-containing protein n=1 Tax=Acinetobacter modestus TaxID=1776740 RepID=UPI0032087FAF